MKAPLILVTVLALNAVPCLAAEAGPACTAKRVEIESQLAEAKARGLSKKVAGLNRALRANQANCTDEALARDRVDSIKKAERELAEREADLASAERAGNAKKIEKQRVKVEEARRDLADAQKPLIE